MFLTPVFKQVAVSLGLITAFIFPSPNHRTHCRCTFGSPCWPSNLEFQTLASQVSQPLLRPVPPATPCYTPALGNCSDVLAHWSSGIWRSDQPGAAELTNWETYTLPDGTIQACYLNTSLGLPCQQGSVPVIGVDARTPKDVQQAVKFARKHNLRLVVKNTGHDFLGRSSGRDSFVIWTHHMKDITFHDKFTPIGASDSVSFANVFTFGAGVQWFEAYGAAEQHDRLIVGGTSTEGSVGAAGGWLQGGGHSLTSPNYGLGIDNLLQVTIVTAKGEHITANAYLNKDLFWAIRGGGAGSWGVVTSVTYKTHPSTPFSAAYLRVNATDAKSTQTVLTEIIRLTPSLVEQGFGGYGFGGVGSVQLFLLSPNVTLEQTQATFRPLFEFLHSQPGLSVDNETILFQDIWQFYNNLPSSGSTGGQVAYAAEVSSWLLPRDIFQTKKPETIAGELLKLSRFAYFLVTGGQVSRVDPESTGLNPAWRNSLAYTVISTIWKDGADSTQIGVARQRFIQDMKTLEGIAPDSGAYSNEASRYEFDWKKSFFGSHYDKLLAIKRKYDPHSLFLVYEGVGSDEWDAGLVCQAR